MRNRKKRPQGMRRDVGNSVPCKLAHLRGVRCNCTGSKPQQPIALIRCNAALKTEFSSWPKSCAAQLQTARYYHRLIARTYVRLKVTVMYLRQLCTAFAIAGVSCGAVVVIEAAQAQLPLPAAKPPDGPSLFKQQCASCHTTNPSDPPRQGPNLVNIVGRPAGKAEGFRYSAGFAQADFVWDESKLDAWLTNPQGLIAGAIMPYRQARPEIRSALIAYMKELH
jgi:cytochrome c